MRRDVTAAASLVAAAIVACVTAFAVHDVGLLFTSAIASVVALLAAVRLATSANRHERAVRLFRVHSDVSHHEGTCVRTGDFSGAVFVGGLARPEIFADADLLDSLSPGERRAVLLHEQHHMRRRDPARMWLEALIKPVAMRWPGGRAWLISRAAEREIRADRYALDNGASVSSVASALLKVQPAGPSVPGFGGVIDLRVAALAGEPVPHSRTWSHWALLLGATGGAALCLSALHAAWVFCCP